MDDASEKATRTGPSATGDLPAESLFPTMDRFGKQMQGPRAPEHLMQTLCEELTATIPGADMVGITLAPTDDDKSQVLACTDARILDIDIDQCSAAEGPSLDCVRSGLVVRVVSEDAMRRWPVFTRQASTIGIASYLAAPLDFDGCYVGALNVYGFGDHGFAEIDEVLLRVFVTAVEGALWRSIRGEQWREETADLRQAMKSRGLIEQAKGMLMAMHAITEDQAFTMIALQSQRQNIRVVAVATDIVRTLSAGTELNQ
ncbi:ANTAR domain-containing protein [Rhodococcus qingshengii]|uniref:GAF and ANTAR domain-containing protein n=1 Tax=Rhodococcus qingshengii TaxID=334542 RepID=UPI0027AACD7E|nr:GAF and ANTAR domain-containing protein [Rhodococcus qingshengii]